jgi:hypothetical protein
MNLMLKYYSVSSICKECIQKETATFKSGCLIVNIGSGDFYLIMKINSQHSPSPQ